MVGERGGGAVSNHCCRGPPLLTTSIGQPGVHLEMNVRLLACYPAVWGKAVSGSCPATHKAVIKSKSSKVHMVCVDLGGHRMAAAMIREWKLGGMQGDSANVERSCLGCAARCIL